MYFDTVKVELGNHKASEVLKALVKRHINVRAFGDNAVTVSLDETTTEKDLSLLFEGFAEVSGKKVDFTPTTLGSNAAGLNFGKKIYLILPTYHIRKLDSY